MLLYQSYYCEGNRTTVGKSVIQLQLQVEHVREILRNEINKNV
jgi:hypothetical protein